MKKIVGVVLSVFILLSCNAQTDKKMKTKKDNLTTNEPKVNYDVNKEYDENGNLIRYDSTYTYYYSNLDKEALINDSVFAQFNRHFQDNKLFDKSFFDDFFMEDEYLKDKFFKEDFFRGNFDKNQKMMEKLMAKMDSLKNTFLFERFPLEENSKK